MILSSLYSVKSKDYYHYCYYYQFSSSLIISPSFCSPLPHVRTLSSQGPISWLYLAVSASGRGGRDLRALAECWWGEVLHLVCSYSLAGFSCLCPHLLWALICGALAVTFCTSLVIDTPTGMHLLSFSPGNSSVVSHDTDPLSGYLGLGSKPVSVPITFQNPHWAHGKLTHLCHTTQWGLELSPETLPLFLTCTGWHVHLCASLALQRALDERHTSALSSRMIPSKLTGQILLVSLTQGWAGLLFAFFNNTGKLPKL